MQPLLCTVQVRRVVSGTVKPMLGTATFALLLIAGSTAVVLMFQRDGIADIIRGVSLLGGAIGVVGGWRFLTDERARFRREGAAAVLVEGWVPAFTAAAFSLGSTIAILILGGAAYYGLEAAGGVLSVA